MEARLGPTYVSVVVPAFNEADCLRELHRRLDAVLPATAEILIVDDASTDETLAVVNGLSTRDARVRALSLPANVGAQRALLQGLARTCGDVTITMDADLQHPPELIPEMLAQWRVGFDVVNMVRSRRLHGGWTRDVLTKAFYGVFALVGDVRLSSASTDFRLLDRRCVDVLLARGSDHPFLRAMVARVGFEQTELTFEPPERFAGGSRYTLPALFRLGWTALRSCR